MKSRPDYDRTVFMVLRAIRGLTDEEVAAKSFLSPTTIKRMRMGPRYGGTRYPQHLTLEAIARSVGMSFKLVDEGEVERDLKAARLEIARLEKQMAKDAEERNLAKIERTMKKIGNRVGGAIEAAG